MERPSLIRKFRAWVAMMILDDRDLKEIERAMYHLRVGDYIQERLIEMAESQVTEDELDKVVIQ